MYSQYFTCPDEHYIVVSISCVDAVYSNLSEGVWYSGAQEQRPASQWSDWIKH